MSAVRVQIPCRTQIVRYLLANTAATRARLHSCVPSMQGTTSSAAVLTQVVVTLAAVAGAAMALANVTGPGAVVLGGGLALSSTAVAMQVLQDRGESGSRHGRATFAVLLLQVSPAPTLVC